MKRYWQDRLSSMILPKSGVNAPPRCTNDIVDEYAKQEKHYKVPPVFEKGVELLSCWTPRAELIPVRRPAIAHIFADSGRSVLTKTVRNNEGTRWFMNCAHVFNHIPFPILKGRFSFRVMRYNRTIHMHGQSLSIHNYYQRKTVRIV